jgi:hypothetical protein
MQKGKALHCRFRREWANRSTASLWIGLDRGMPQDAAAILEEILGEADALIRQRLKDRSLELPHLVIAVTADGEVVLRSNVSADVLRSSGKT